MTIENQATQPTEPTISLNDLAVMIQIIDLGSEKGLFKGPDLKPVGELREKIVAVIKQSQQVEGDSNESIGAEPK
jgi:hypothetical protein